MASVRATAATFNACASVGEVTSRAAMPPPGGGGASLDELCGAV
eukprot:CAMPEP_0169087872 /NCGR_PEP_ID=MMETSP1015-20121227/14457_1 /TAXON_ID=342587 /ORGANISM="Karlodinium micrum, Strain CCMP2283" /LENGTH=43 /DNA_ID= /DNA_START= /DNA_END= /DNA_ORIENTATION=